MIFSFKIIIPLKDLDYCFLFNCFFSIRIKKVSKFFLIITCINYSVSIFINKSYIFNKLDLPVSCLLAC